MIPSISYRSTPIRRNPTFKCPLNETIKSPTVPDNIVLKCLTERLSNLDCAAKGWVLRGYPKSRNQAEALTEAGYAPNRYKICCTIVKYTLKYTKIHAIH